MKLDNQFHTAIKPTNPVAFRDELLLGHAIASASSIQFLALTRNVASCWPRFIDRILRLGEAFGNWSLACYENDSDDGTVAAIRDSAAQYPRVSLLSETLGKKKWHSCRSPQRGQDMGNYRERLRSYALSMPTRPEFIALFDVDVEAWSPESFLSALPAIRSHNAIWAFGIQVHHRKLEYYDAWATRLSTWQEMTYRFTANKLAHLWPGKPVEPALSGFGGVAIYRREFYERGTYHGDDCEHVNFHRTARFDSAPIGIVHPNLITLRHADRFALRLAMEASRKFQVLRPG